MHDRPTSSHAAAERKQPLRPPHGAWPLIIVLLLGISVAAAVVTVVAAYADGGAQVVAGSPYDPHRDETAR